MVSLVAPKDRNLVVAVTSNFAYANAPAIARRVAEAFPARDQARRVRIASTHSGRSGSRPKDWLRATDVPRLVYVPA